jgi:phospholipid N-methyltransferase
VPDATRVPLKELLLFGRNFLKHPKMLGSVIPSSRFLVNRLLRQIDWQRARVIVEYGPGVGTITREMLRRMRPDAVLVAIEMNEDFVAFLRRTIPDPRLRVVHGSAADVQAILRAQGLEHAQYAVSGIPFTTLPPAVLASVMDGTRAVLGREGMFVVYQFTRAVLPYLQETFEEIGQGFEPLNILPARVFFCRLGDEAVAGGAGNGRANGNGAAHANGNGAGHRNGSAHRNGTH